MPRYLDTSVGGNYVNIHHSYKIASSEMSHLPSPRTDKAPADSDQPRNSHGDLHAFVQEDKALKLQLELTQHLPAVMRTAFS